MTISLVSITDKNNKIQDNDSLRSLVGQRAALVLDKNNKADARAVKAVFNHYVGFVRMADVHNGIYNLVTRQKYSPIATVIAMGEYRGCLVAEVEYAGDAPEIIDLQKIHAQWKYDGPVFPEIPEIEKLNNATRYLLALLVNQNADYENINERFETFVSLMKYGFSKEFNDKRREIDQLLKKYPDEKVRELRDKLKEISKTIHSEKSRYQAFSHIIKKMKKYIDRNFKEQALKYSISEITKQIKAFPSRITKDTDSTKVYPLRVYYEFMSENVLYKLFSAYALLGYLGEQQAKGEKEKKKRGRPKNEKFDPCPILKHIIGNSRLRDQWFEYIQYVLNGKKNMEAGYVMKAFIDRGVLDSASYRIVKDSFGDIGTDRIYNKALKEVPEQFVENYNFLCKIIDKQKEVFLSSISN